MKTKKIITLFALVLTAVMLLSACGSTKTERQQAPQEEPAGRREVTPGTSQDDALEIGLNAKVFSRYEEGYAWYSFTTGGKADTPYYISVVNMTADSDDLYAYLYDASGEQQIATKDDNDDYYDAIAVARQSGRANTGMIDTLEPNTTYDLRISGSSAAYYSLVIWSGDTAQDTETRETLSADADLVLATNMNDAPLAETNVKYHGEYEDGYLWVAFKTGSAKGAEYRVSLENTSADSDDLYAYLYDEYGFQQIPTDSNNDDYYDAIALAKKSGTVNTGMIDTLKPDSTYYLVLSCRSGAAFNLTISAPQEKPAADAASGAEADLFRIASTYDSITPGTSQSSALLLPMGTKVYGEYTDGYAWVAFTTGSEKGAQYCVSVVNMTVDSDDLYAYLYDEYGEQQIPTEDDNDDYYDALSVARQSGRANTGMIDTLEPNTTYYLRLSCRSAAKYSIRITEPSAKSTAVRTSSSMNESAGALEDAGDYETGTNQNAATMLKTNVKYHGSFQKGYAWVAFRTGSAAGTEYRVSLENLTPKSQDLYAYLYDEYGFQQIPTDSNNDDYYDAIAVAKQDGTVNTGMIATLEPNTTYYLCISGRDAADYNLTISTKEPEGSGNTVSEAEGGGDTAADDALVIEVPFELNSTTLMFVADKAEFLDPAAARAALQPVADVILAHPGHPILIAGTTAKVSGNQASCVALSEQRAQAVKDLLVQAFGVPESQLQVVGLGFADDPFVRGEEWDANGSFVETEAAKNRRVVVLDAESDVAKQILGG